MLTAGELLDRYVIEGVLGEGGFATVYKARHTALQSLHAIKVLQAHLFTDEGVRSRFLDEGRFQAKLRHPNIVPVTDIVVGPNLAGLVMDYIEGESLEAFIRRQPSPAAPDVVREIFSQVLAAVGFAHRKGVIHRDLKPDNILLESQDVGAPVARVVDFGIAKAMSEGPQTGRTVTGMAMGTPHYMSPEQILDPKSVTAQSDVFSLGVTLYQLATGVLPFDAASAFSISTKIVSGEYQPPERVHAGVDPSLAVAIERALARAPRERFASCEEFAESLKAHAVGVAATLVQPRRAAGASSDRRLEIKQRDHISHAPAPADLSSAEECEAALVALACSVSQRGAGQWAITKSTGVVAFVYSLRSLRDFVVGYAKEVGSRNTSYT